MIQITLRKTLRKKVVFLFVFFSFLPLMIISLLITGQIQNYLKETVSSNLIFLAKESMRGIEKIGRDIFANIEILALNPIIVSEKATLEEKLLEMKKNQEFYGLFEDITLLDLEGKIIASTSYGYREEWITKPWYQKAKEGKTSISLPYVILNPFKIILSLAAPIKNKKGEIRGVITGQINMERIWEIVDGLQVGKKGFAFIVDKDGRFISHREKEKILSLVPYADFFKKISDQESGIINYHNEKNEEMIAGFVSLAESKLKEQDWKLIVAQPKKEVFALLNVFQKQIIVIFFVGFILILTVAYFLNLSIIQPIKKLTEAAREVAKGKLETRIEIKTGDEIEKLGEAFNQMIKDLKESHSALEEAKTVLEIKVAARTKELQELIESREEIIKERTRELQERIKELERFHRLTVGRELKMIELKKDIKKLKDELEQYKK